MPWAITRLCVDCLDTGCVSVCPDDCIYEPIEPGKDGLPKQLYINPDECIDCGACEPECPWQAIYEEPAVPELFQRDVALNRRTVESPEKFRVKTFEEKPGPTPEEIEENKRKWGLK
jgi:ferredoxin